MYETRKVVSLIRSLTTCCAWGSALFLSSNGASTLFTLPSCKENVISNADIFLSASAGVSVTKTVTSVLVRSGEGAVKLVFNFAPMAKAFEEKQIRKKKKKTKMDSFFM